MLRLRPFVLVLALLVSPVGAAVCEVVCGSPVHAAHAPAAVQTGATPHAHHEHHAHHAPAAAPQVPPASDADGRMHEPGPACDPLLAIPGRVRSPFSGPDLHAVVLARVVPVAASQALTCPRVGPADTGPPDPPRSAPVPLRI